MLVHSGSAGSGHYWTCARIPEQAAQGMEGAKKRALAALGISSGESDGFSDGSSESDGDNDCDHDNGDESTNIRWKWYKFDDDRVEKISQAEGMDMYFGHGGNPPKFSSPAKQKVRHRSLTKAPFYQ